MGVPLLTKLPTPALPASGNVRDVAWAAPDGKYLAVGFDASPWLTVYTRNTDLLETPLTIPTPPTTTVASCDWSPNGQFLAIGEGENDNIPIKIWERAGTTMTRLADGPLTSGIGKYIALLRWSPDGNYIFTAQSGDPFVKRVFLWGVSAAGIITYLDEVVVNSTGGGPSFTSCAWSPDSTYIIGGLTTTNQTQTDQWVVKRTGNNIALVATMVYPVNPTFQDFAWSPDSAVTIAAGSGSAIVYTRTGDTFSAGTDNVPAAVAATVKGVAAVRAQDGSVAVAWDSALRLMERAGETLTQVRAYPTPTGATAQRRVLRWTADGSYLVHGFMSSPIDLDWWKVGGTPPPLRQRQRDDGLGNSGPRQRGAAKNAPTSKQRSVRQGWNNVYL